MDDLLAAGSWDEEMYERGQKRVAMSENELDEQNSGQGVLGFNLGYTHKDKIGVSAETFVQAGDSSNPDILNEVKAAEALFTSAIGGCSIEQVDAQVPGARQ